MSQTVVFVIPGAAWRRPQASVPKLELGNEVETERLNPEP